MKGLFKVGLLKPIHPCVKWSTGAAINFLPVVFYCSEEQ